MVINLNILGLLSRVGMRGLFYRYATALCAMPDVVNIANKGLYSSPSPPLFFKSCVEYAVMSISEQPNKY